MFLELATYGFLVGIPRIDASGYKRFSDMSLMDGGRYIGAQRDALALEWRHIATHDILRHTCGLYLLFLSNGWSRLEK